MDGLLPRQQDSDDKRVRLMQLQRDLTILQSDEKKFLVRKDSIEVALRRSRRQLELAQIELESMQDELKKVQEELRRVGEEIAWIRKKINQTT